MFINKIIGITGQKMSGKNTVADYLFENHNYIKLQVNNKFEKILNKLLTNIDKHKEIKIVVCGVKLREQVEFIKSLGGKIIRIDRFNGKLDLPRNENNTDKLNVDFVFTNNSTKEKLFDYVSYWLVNQELY